MGQEGVLLGLVETVHLVDEQDGLPALALVHAGAFDRLAYLLDPGQHGRDLDEVGVEVMRGQACQRGLADAGRAPQDHGMQPAGLEGQPDRHAGAQQVRLADHLVDAGRTQAFGQGGGLFARWQVGAGKEVGSHRWSRNTQGSRSISGAALRHASTRRVCMISPGVVRLQPRPSQVSPRQVARIESSMARLR